MKKIYVLALALTVSFISCEKEEVSEIEDSSLESVEHRYRYKKCAHGKRKGYCKKYYCHNNSNNECEPISDFETSLPLDINFCSTDRGTNTGLSYWDITINDSDLAGEYQAWCLDANRGLGLDCFDAQIVSSNADLSDTPISITENMDIINWILNNDFVGKDSPNGTGQYTFGDVQIAIWHFVDNANEPWSGNNVGEWNEDRVQEIIDLATLSGKSYEPKAGEFFGLIILPIDTSKQPLLVPYQLKECKKEEKQICKRKRCKGRWYKHYGKYKKCNHYSKRKWWWNK